jgi:hypothetical protein
VLALAGACFFGAMSHGPALYRNTDLSHLPAEHQEAIEEAFNKDLRAAVAWHGIATMMVADGENDEHFEPVHQTLVRAGEDRDQLTVLVGRRK